MNKANTLKLVRKKTAIIIITISLLLLWFTLTLWRITSSDISFSVLTFSHGKDNLQSANFSELLANDKITGQFIAKEDNLGIVSIRFNTFNKISRDAIVFKIRRKGDNKWHYENKYNVNQFTHKDLYPFGFQKIENSKDKVFIFEVISLNGKRGNSVAISEQFPILTSHYQYNKDVILSSPSSFLDFLWKKALRSFQQSTVLFSSLIYLTPLIFYIFYIYKKTFFLNRHFFTHLGILAAIDIFLIQQILSSVYILHTIVFLILLSLKSMTSNKIFSYSIIFLIISVMLSLLGKDLFAEKTSIWFYILLLIGTGKSIIAVRTQ
jgi:cell division protein FtsB